MIAPESNRRTAPASTIADPATDPATDLATDPADQSDEPVTTLRGARVEVDVGRAARVVSGVCLAAIAVTAVILLIAGIQKNQQITSLQRHGVPVRVTVSNCIGLMGGSGTNVAGYACTGTYTVNGHDYKQAIPGTALHQPGSTVQGVTVPGDPGLLSTPGQVAGDRASWRVFIAPAVLLVGLVVLVGIVIRRRSHRAEVEATSVPQPHVPAGTGGPGAR
ncbi:MAG: hypothetical protein IVW52_00270 [Acidimicrobiales bacterium]|nr:hypothetical protein [Acidimicrobiales bacterium]